MVRDGRVDLGAELEELVGEQKGTEQQKRQIARLIQEERRRRKEGREAPVENEEEVEDVETVRQKIQETVRRMVIENIEKGNRNIRSREEILAMEGEKGKKEMGEMNQKQEREMTEMNQRQEMRMAEIIRDQEIEKNKLKEKHNVEKTQLETKIKKQDEKQQVILLKMKKTVEDLIKELEVDAEAGASAKKQKITDDGVEELSLIHI